MFLLLVLIGLLAAASLENIQATGSTLVIADPQRKSLQVMSVVADGGGISGHATDLAKDFDDICCTAAAGDYAFVAGTKNGKDLVAVATISGDAIKVERKLLIKGLDRGFFGGCILTGEDIAAKKSGASYEMYVVVGCRLSKGERPAGNYVIMYTFVPSSGKLIGPSEQRRYYVNIFDGTYGFVSVVNAMSVLGGGASGSGTVYAVMTTTSTANGKVYKPALHVFKDRKAVPLGILATAPDMTDGVELPHFAVASPTSFYSAFRQRCHFLPGANHCSKYPFNAQELVTVTRQGKGTKTIGAHSTTSSFSPSALAVSPSQQVLYRLTGSAITTEPSGISLAVRGLAAADGANFRAVANLSLVSEGLPRREVLLQIVAF